MADLFCGAGGSSTGAEKAVKALGRKMTLVCINHWPVAIETHKLNHPTARHYIEDIAVADPERIVTEGYLDLLMASPECRFDSRARGGKPTQDQGRMNPWAIHRWLTSLDVRTALIENVPEFIHWGPVDSEGRPDRKHKGKYFQAWLHSIWDLGYKAEWKYLNAADYGDATTRTRFFLQARKDGRPIHWPVPTHSESGDADMIESRPKWRAASEIIEWDKPGRSLLDDAKYIKRPLSENTRRRIARGLEKFGGALAPFYIALLGLENHCPNCGAWEATCDGETIKCLKCGFETPGVAWLATDPKPFVMGKQTRPSIRGTDSPIPTQTTQGAMTLIEPTAEPFVLGQQSQSAARSTAKPIPTVCAGGAISVTTPLMVKYYGTGVCHPTAEPVPTITTKKRVGLVNALASPFVVQNRIRPDGDRVYDIEEPLKTVTGHGAGSLVTPILVEVNHQGKGDRSSSSDKPLKTVTAKRGTSLVTPFITQIDQVGFNGNGVSSVEEPLPTIVTKQNAAIIEGQAVVMPVLEKATAGMDPRRLVIIDGEVHLLDLRFRMLNNLELARAMGFTDKESTYEFVGNTGEVTRQIGNAVPVNLAAALVGALLQERK